MAPYASPINAVHVKPCSSDLRCSTISEAGPFAGKVDTGLEWFRLQLTKTNPETGTCSSPKEPVPNCCVCDLALEMWNSDVGQEVGTQVSCKQQHCAHRSRDRPLQCQTSYIGRLHPLTCSTSPISCKQSWVTPCVVSRAAASCRACRPS
jgi:hypothetical protein